MWLGRKGAPISRLHVAFAITRQSTDQGLEPGIVAAVAELPEYLDELVSRTFSALGEGLVGVYLHGSAAMEAFVPSRSDVDVLAVTASAPSPTTKLALANSLSEAALPSPGVGLELSVVTALSASTPSEAPRFELHIATQEGVVVDGLKHAGDPDLVAHFAMTRARGLALLGPSPGEVFAAVDRASVLRCFADDLTWALDRGLTGYAVLNACRALRFARDGGLYSKLEGGTWALDEGIGDPALIAAALRRQQGADEVVDADAAASFASSVREELAVAGPK
jgi:streptomycin 3"-adenylyltransferase